MLITLIGAFLLGFIDDLFYELDPLKGSFQLNRVFR